MLRHSDFVLKLFMNYMTINLWNTSFSAICIVALLLSYSLMGHSEGKSIFINKSLIQFSSSVTLPLPCTRLCTGPREHTLLLTFSWHKISFKKTISCGRPSIKRAPSQWETCYSSVAMIWIEKSFSWSFLQIPHYPHYLLQVGSPRC